MKLLVATGSGWSLVYTLNNGGGGDITEPCGRPFRWFHHLPCLQFNSTLNRRFDNIVLINFVSSISSVAKKSGTKRTKKREKSESTPALDEMHTKAPSSIFLHHQNAQLILQYIMKLLDGFSLS